MTSWGFDEHQISADKINSMTATSYDIYYQEEHFGLIYRGEGWILETSYLDKNKEDLYSIRSGPYYYFFEVLLVFIFKVVKNYVNMVRAGYLST